MTFPMQNHRSHDILLWREPRFEPAHDTFFSITHTEVVLSNLATFFLKNQFLDTLGIFSYILFYTFDGYLKVRISLKPALVIDLVRMSQKVIRACNKLLVFGPITVADTKFMDAEKRVYMEADWSALCKSQRPVQLVHS